jgi:hypothetical protein
MRLSFELLCFATGTRIPVRSASQSDPRSCEQSKDLEVKALVVATSNAGIDRAADYAMAATGVCLTHAPLLKFLGPCHSCVPV